MEDRDSSDWVTSSKPTESVGRDSGAERPPKRRVLTEARREQNRLAQRAYRKRQKEQRKQLKEAESERQQTRRLRPLLKRCDSAPKYTRRSPNTPNHAQESFKEDIGSEQGRPQNDISTREGAIQPHQPSPSETGDSVSLSISSEELIAEDTNFIKDATNTPTELQRHDLQLLPARHPSSKFRASQHSTDSKGDELMLPDIYPNMLQFIPVTVAHAVFQNALSMGLDLSIIANCGVDCISPFYQPSLSSTTDPTLLLKYGAASTASFKNTSIPIHLRPTLAQVLIPHHAGLDLIPLPFLRERAIMLSAAMPDAFNTWELKLDIYERGGLSIWRQSQSATERRSNNTYQPWDMRSWEAAPWFLKKWTMIIGDEESEFYKQSIGWQLIRDLILSQGGLQLGNGDT